MALLPQEKVKRADARLVEPGVSLHPQLSSVPEAPALLEDEQRVLKALDRTHRLTIAQLVSRTTLGSERVSVALGALGHKGLVSRLNTVIESFCARLPGVRVGGGAARALCQAGPHSTTDSKEE